MTRRGPALAAALLAAAALGAGCRGEAPTPEEEVRATIAAAERAVAEHDLPALKRLIAADYRDVAGRDRAALESLLTVHFLRNSRIHVLVRIRELTVDPKGRASVEALVATAGRPIPALDALARVDADLLWVDLGLARRGGGWAVTHADWERARLEDLL
ncbi:MAG TPA: hypothetical protein VKB65_13510 [Myxococcota bacterium]|nr:hypothetical protein [Myxococcota bacterium]